MTSIFRAKALLVVPTLMLSSFFSLNCGDETSSSSNSTTTGSSSGAGGEAAGGAGGAGGEAAGGAGGAGGGSAGAGGGAQSVVGTFQLGNNANLPIPGIPVTYGQDMQTTDMNGKVTFNMLSGSAFEVIAKSPDNLLLHFFGIAGTNDFSQTRGMVSEASITQLMGALGLTYDPTKAVVSIIGLDSNMKALAGSFTVNTSVAYDDAFVEDSSSPFGYTKSNSTIAGGGSTVFLVNVAPGLIPLDIKPPAGMASCTTGPGIKPLGEDKLMGYAHETSTAAIVCQ